MAIIIERQLTRVERLAQIMKQIEEAEEHGFAEIKISIHNNQIIGSSINKEIRYGNTDQSWYTTT